MTEQEYLKMIDQINARHQEDVKALKRVWEIFSPGISVPTVSVSQPRFPVLADEARRVRERVRLEAVPHRTIADSIDRAINEIEGEFDWKIIGDHIQKTSPNIVINKSTFWQYMRKLIKKNRIAVVSEGKGRNPTTYKKIQ